MQPPQLLFNKSGACKQCLQWACFMAISSPPVPSMSPRNRDGPYLQKPISHKPPHALHALCLHKALHKALPGGQNAQDLQQLEGGPAHPQTAGAGLQHNMHAWTNRGKACGVRQVGNPTNPKMEDRWCSSCRCCRRTSHLLALVGCCSGFEILAKFRT